MPTLTGKKLRVTISSIWVTVLSFSGRKEGRQAGRKEGRQGRKEGRKEGRKDDLRVQKFSYLLQPLLIPLSARASCFTQHACNSHPCTLRSRVMTEDSPLQWLFAPAYFDAVAMAIFFCSIRSNLVLFAYHRHAAELHAPTGILYETARCSSQVMDNAHVR